MQPAVAVDGHRAALELLEVGWPCGTLEERDQSLDAHGWRAQLESGADKWRRCILLLYPK